MSLRPLLPKLQQHHAAYTIPISSSLAPFVTYHRPTLLSATSSASSSSSSFPSSSSRSHFSTSLPRLQDHYKILGVSRSASSKEIKAQFYQLSKRYHPDVNRDDEGAKKKFQEVSEAWGVLGNERGRRDYDRQLRTGGGGGGGGPTQNYSYDPGDNAARRARATYAWEYQRRRGDSNRGRAGQARSGRAAADEQEDTRSAHARARGAFGAGPGGVGGGRGSGAESSLFEKYAAQQRKREEFASSRTSGAAGSAGYGGASGSGSASDPFSTRVEEHEAQGASPIIRFIQIIGTLTFIFAVATSLGTGGSSGGGGGRLRAERQCGGNGEEEEEEEWRGKTVMVLSRSARGLSALRGERLDNGVRID
ncbi:DnaJ-domain-containing protein [Microstroma glucosiphilum]|uniref:DnaJ-domain-containing protein n=1 Tax=Pseudomicrostroma glucosiphilum TaxID=1684307 RepID=A0A316U0Y3_9BASI|nr:DnaJ-domain-containing protein [Pseudomicrostroma glucosiphilum]PWN18518.1 DnaJ-domain-containing protein [Pseudomicrostroma glucosiphilum]